MPTAAAALSATIAALHPTARTNFAKPGKAERAQIDDMWPTDDVIRMRKELAEQRRALKDLASMAKLPELKAHT